MTTFRTSELKSRLAFLLQEQDQRERQLMDRGIKNFESDASWRDTKKQLDKVRAELRK